MYIYHQTLNSVFLKTWHAFHLNVSATTVHFSLVTSTVFCHYTKPEMFHFVGTCNFLSYQTCHINIKWWM